MMTDTTPITCSDATRAELREAGAACRAADAADQGAQDALARARAHLVACQAEVDRWAADRASWIERAAKKADAEIVAGRTPHAAPTVDATSQLAHATAAANLEKAQQVVEWRETAAAETCQRREAAHARLLALYVAEDTRHVDELLQQIAAKRAEVDDLRALAGSPLCARELHGMGGFSGIVTLRQIELLNTPPEPPLDVAALFEPRRDTPKTTTAPRQFHSALGYWRSRREQLEAIAAGEGIEAQVQAA
jgi:hypothetical protein